MLSYILPIQPLIATYADIWHNWIKTNKKNQK